MSLGLKRGTVQLEPHDKQWDEAAIQTIKNLKSILGDDAVDIQHIGSTAIPAIKAKPIIDIAVGVTDFEKIMSYNEQLQKEGIFYRGSDVEDQILYFYSLFGIGILMLLSVYLSFIGLCPAVIRIYQISAKL